MLKLTTTSNEAKTFYMCNVKTLNGPSMPISGAVCLKGNKMNTIKRVLLIAVALSGISTGRANAAMLWTLDQVTTVGTSQYHLGVPGSLTGSFEYDPTSGLFSSILIHHVPDVVGGGITFSTFVSGDANTLSLLNGPPSPDGSIGRHGLDLVFLAPLSGAGGTIALSGSATYFTGLRSEDITGGSVLSDPIPEPTTLSLLTLGGLMILRRRR